MNLLAGISSTADALQAEKLRMNVVSQNIANAFTTRDANGEPYKRKVVSFEAYVNPTAANSGNGAAVRGVRISQIADDATPGKAVYNPGHPDADENGMVMMPNVEISREMVDLVTSSRAYEANLQVVRIARSMAQQALAIGKA